ncbi:energy-coupling factor ABC transporter ATP-binding protein [Phascolarctobacterium sp.]|uniref:energy-coupling factor ABC transporter ATP-binding protein n=1 Tax=Phascolarctobacterium sp. TaxID=2049039 RepID=UPI0038684226
MEHVIKVKDFYFAYKSSPNLVLQDINLEIKKGSFTAITGPSGAGKTTLCKALTGIVPYYMGGRYSGDVEIHGESTKGKRVSDIAMRVGFIMEDYESQLVSLTAGEEIAFALLNHGFAPAEIAERTARALEDVGLPGRESYQLDELSGGQRQRLLLAATLAVHPEIIVLDEPVSAMDPDGAQSLYKLVYDIHQRYGTTIVAVEHRMDYLLPYVTDMVVLKEGRLIAADAYESAAPKMYEDPALRPLLPTLWQVKLGLEEKLSIDLGDWRCEQDALSDFKTYGIVAREGRAD